jgi:seryl-tRNA synthetase
MYDLRIKLIKDDPSIKKLHQRIIALHKELSLKIDSKKEMRVLIEQEKRLNAQIEQLNKQLDKKEK